MTARVNQLGITILGISNESQMEQVSVLVDQSKCRVTFKDNHTRAIVTGEDKQRCTFIKLWNSEEN